MENQKYKKLSILIVDDEELWLHGISLTLERYGGTRNIMKCKDSLQVMDILSENRIGLIMLDLVMPNLSGEQLLSMIVESYPEIPVIVLTGMNQVEIGIKCMKLGAFDFFVKTVGKDELIASVERAMRLLEMRNINESLTEHFLCENLRQPEAFSGIITQDQRMKSIFRYIEAIGQSSQPLMISGESGTGKELIAIAAHHVSHPDEPFISINVAGLDDNVFADTLFGHMAGAFTGAEQHRAGLIKKAGQGVIFLDEIGDLSMASQIKLLRVLQEGEFLPLGSDVSVKTNVRFFFATNKDLHHQMETGKFRKDLYYRIRIHYVHLPPLKERLGDLPLLVGYFIKKTAASMGVKPPDWGNKLITLLERYDFPGNIRELSSIIYDAVSQGEDVRLSLETVRKALGKRLKKEVDVLGHDESRPTNNVSFSQQLPTFHQMNRLLSKEAMRRSNGNQTIAASMLGISQPSLSRRLKLLDKKKDEED